MSEQTSALSPADYAPEDDDGPHTASYDREQLPAALAVGNENDIEPERRAKRRAWTVTLLIALLLVLVGGGYYLYNVLVQNAAPETVAVPAVAGLDQNEATNALWEAGLRPRVELEFSNDVEKDMVTRTDPEIRRTGGTGQPGVGLHFTGQRIHRHPGQSGRPDGSRSPRQASPTRSRAGGQRTREQCHPPAGQRGHHKARSRQEGQDRFQRGPDRFERLGQRSQHGGRNRRGRGSHAR